METLKIKVETIYTFELKYSTWYIDHNDYPEIQKPFSVHHDEHYINSYKTIGEAFERIFSSVGHSDWKKK